MKVNELKIIKIEEEDKIKGFHVLINNGSPTTCLPDNVYIVPKSILNDLKRKKIKFSEIKDGNQIKRSIPCTPKV